MITRKRQSYNSCVVAVFLIFTLICKIRTQPKENAIWKISDEIPRAFLESTRIQALFVPSFLRDVSKDDGDFSRCLFRIQKTRPRKTQPRLRGSCMYCLWSKRPPTSASISFSSDTRPNMHTMRDWNRGCLSRVLSPTQRLRRLIPKPKTSSPSDRLTPRSNGNEIKLHHWASPSHTWYTLPTSCASHPHRSRTIDPPTRISKMRSLARSQSLSASTQHAESQLICIGKSGKPHNGRKFMVLAQASCSRQHHIGTPGRRFRKISKKMHDGRRTACPS